MSRRPTLLLGLASVSIGVVPPAHAAGSQPAASPPLIPALHGLLVTDVSATTAGPIETRPGIRLAAATLPDPAGLRPKLGRFIGRPVTASTLGEIQSAIIKWSRAHGYPFVAVTFPEQDLSGGVLKVVFTEFRAGTVEAKGARWFSNRAIRRGVRLKPGERINGDRLDRDLAALNDNPFRTVDAVAQKSATPGFTDIEIRTRDRPPFRFETSVDNSGVAVLGRQRWTAGVTWGDAFGQGQQLTYRFTSSEPFWRWPTRLPVRAGAATLEVHSVSDTIPLPWRDRIVVFGAYDRARPELGADFAQAGVDWQTGFRYIKPLTFRGWPRQEIQFGFDFRRSNNDLQFGGVLVSHTSVDTAQFLMSYALGVPDRWGETSINTRIVFSPGGLTGGDSDAAYQPSADHSGIAFAHARYVYDDTTVSRVTRLPAGFTSILKVEGQISTANLLSSEKLSAGGGQSLRGYDPFAASGSIGLLASHEFRSPPLAPARWLTHGAIADQLQFDAFSEMASTREVDRSPGQLESATLASVGAGFRYAVGRKLAIGVDYGWPLLRAPNGGTLGGRLQLSVTLGN